MTRPITAVALFTVALVLAGCGSPAADNPTDEEQPAVIEKIEGAENRHRITLTERAFERLGIETVEVARSAGVGGRTQVPYSSIFYNA